MIVRQEKANEIDAVMSENYREHERVREAFNKKNHFLIDIRQ